MIRVWDLVLFQSGGWMGGRRRILKLTSAKVVVEDELGNRILQADGFRVPTRHPLKIFLWPFKGVQQFILET